MARLIRRAAVLALSWAQPASPAAAGPIDVWTPYIAEASQRFGIPADWIARVMRAESGGRTTLNGRPITSSAGAMGLMQLMPGTWAELRARLSLGADPHDPRDNILAGACYLRLMYDRFGYPGLFAAYNAGPERYAAWLGGRRQLPGETQAYLAFVTDGGAAAMHPAARPSRHAVAPRLFFALRERPDRPTPEGAEPAALFVPLRSAAGGHAQ